MKTHLPSSRSGHGTEGGSALVVAMIFLAVMAASIAVVQTYTSSVVRSTGNNAEFLRANAAAEAAAEVVIGRLIQWVTANNGDCPSIQDCKTPSVGSASNKAINSSIDFSSAGKLSDYTASILEVSPLLPDDGTETTTTSPRYLADYNGRQSVSDNSPNSSLRYYYTSSASLNAKNIESRSITYRIKVSVAPKVKTLKMHGSQTITRYLRCDKVSPFAWCTYRFGSVDYASQQIYQGPMYIAKDLGLYGSGFTDSVLYGKSVSASKNGDGTYSSRFYGGGFDAQVKQSALLSLVPNLVNNLARDSSNKRQSSYEDSTSPLTTSGPRPADTYSQRELIEPPTNPANDTTPSVIADARIYNQADARIKISVDSNGIVSKTVVDVKGNIVNSSTNAWVTPLLAAVNVKTKDSSTPFYDRNRSSSVPVQVTDIDVGKVKTVMEANPTVFPTGILYAWDSTGLGSTGNATSSRPLTGIRVWNAGELPNGGLVLGSNDPVYLKGDFNSGAKLPANATIDDVPLTDKQPATNGSSWANNNGVTTPSDRVVAGYQIQPGGVFGDAVIELSNGWKDANSLNTQNAKSTTINLVEGWSTMQANNLNDDDTYNNNGQRANPVWVENWNGARRTMSGEEFCVWHSRYSTGNTQSGGGWAGDISYDRKASNLKLNWGVVNFVRDRIVRGADK